jgi:carboxylesterase
MKKRLKKTKYLALLIPTIFIITFLLYAYFETGMFSPNHIDDEDLARWEYKNGIIKGAEEISIQNNKETCWLLIHGYASTPKDMDELASKISHQLNDSVRVPRLQGHGEVPSNLLELNINNWYSQSEAELFSLIQQCTNVNIVGFSMGGVIALKLAQNNEINNLYLISPYLRLRYKFWNILSKESYLNLLADSFIYKKKNNVAQINSPEGIEDHISYISTPLQPIKNSFPLIDEIILNLNNIEYPTLIQHSKNDDTIDIESSQIVLNKISSNNKELITYTNSNHVLLSDFDKDEVINNIINFELQTR